MHGRALAMQAEAARAWRVVATQAAAAGAVAAGAGAVAAVVATDDRAVRELESLLESRNKELADVHEK
jgi:hypothetical protein